jgi:feruloyl esterase
MHTRLFHSLALSVGVFSSFVTAAPAHAELASRQTQPPRTCDAASLRGNLLADINGIIPVKNIWIATAKSTSTGHPVVGNVCDVTVGLIPTNSSNTIRFQLWMPFDRSSWKDGLLTVGNGGVSGGFLAATDLYLGIAKGFAAMTTDTGHNTTGPNDMTFAGVSDAQKDWANRAMQYSVPVAKHMVQRYYGQAPTRTYYAGCSTGGRQGLRQIITDPNSFDGLLIGAPAWDWSHSLARLAQLQSQLLKAGDFLKNKSNTLIQLLYNRTIQSCDRTADNGGTDNVNDNIVSDPDRCATYIDFAGAPIECQPGVSPNDCLTKTEINNLKLIYENTEQFVFDAFTVSSALNWKTYANPAQLVTGYLTYFLGRGTWTWEKNSADILAAADADFEIAARDFAKLAGYSGKIIMYHGMDDPIISLGSSRRFREGMVGAGASANRFRYFEISGMQHCFNARDFGYGDFAPWYLGGAGLSTATGATFAPTNLDNRGNDALRALIDWVSNDDNAPPSLNVTSFNPRGFTVRKSRLACPYPQVATLVAGQSPNTANNWRCG